MRRAIKIFWFVGGLAVLGVLGFLIWNTGV